MATLGSKLLTKEMQWNANMTELNHLGASLLAKPTVMVGAMDKLFSSQSYYSDNPLSSTLAQVKGGEDTIGNLEWEWEMRGATTRPLISLENVNDPLDTTLGKHGRTFKIKLDENWYLPGDYIHPGTSNKKYQLRIQSQAIPHGDGFVFNVVLASGNPQDFLPAKFLNYGQQWAKLFSKYGEANEQRGSTQFSTPLGFRNKMSKFGKQYKITDYASTEVLSVAIPVEQNGKVTYVTNWMKYAEVEYWQQWYKELERGYWYGRTDDALDANGRQVQSGPGIQQQLEDSHIHRYSHLTTKLIEEYLMDIFYSRTKPGKGRQIKGFTGEYGMLMFHRAIQNWADKGGFVKNVEVYTNKVASTIHTNALEAGYQYVKYNMANGASLELIHNPLYDDRDINFEIDPITGFPIESQRITFLDFSGEGSGSNIQIKNRKDSFAFGYVEGLYGPYGPKKGGSSAHGGSYYEMHVEKTTGVHIHDVTKCGELILSRN